MAIKPEDRTKAKTIIKIVCDVYNVEEFSICMTGKETKIGVAAKWNIFYLLRKHLGWTYSEISNFIGVAPTTVLNGYKKHQAKFLAGNAPVIEIPFEEYIKNVNI